MCQCYECCWLMNATNYTAAKWHIHLKCSWFKTCMITLGQMWIPAIRTFWACSNNSCPASCYQLYLPQILFILNCKQIINVNRWDAQLQSKWPLSEIFQGFLKSVICKIQSIASYDITSFQIRSKFQVIWMCQDKFSKRQFHQNGTFL